jgi:hypothetical protein
MADQVERMHEKMDEDHDGKIEWTEFVLVGGRTSGGGATGMLRNVPVILFLGCT